MRRLAVCTAVALAVTAWSGTAHAEPADCSWAETASRLLTKLRQAGDPQAGAGIRTRLLELGFGADGSPPARCTTTRGGEDPLQGVPERGIFAGPGTGEVITVGPGESIGAANPEPGDVVEIAAGTYAAFTPTSGADGAYVTYRAAPGAEVVITGGGDGILDLQGASWVHLDGLTVRDAGRFAIQITDSDHIAITDCEIDGSQDGGMRIYGSRYIHVEGCDVHGTNAKGTSADSEALSLEQVDTFEVLNNRVHDNGEEGIDVKYGSTNGAVHHNAAWGNRGPNIYLDGASAVDVHHNWAWATTESSKPGIMLAAESQWSDGNISDITVRDNVVWGNAGGGITLWEGDFSGITIIDNVFGDGDSPPEGGPDGVGISGNTTGPIPGGIASITGDSGDSTSGRRSAGSGDEEDQ
ncbi:Right handed beta helix region [Pseudonocardia thermophila]|uniref:Right handed beta helix region n=1 Tax=Pseudonocardia thermophila TaxID=1848 RepID=A0A1M6UD54_PSETH|nr:right-handed parallel beta-helix repeat-containing protein [Pseudonocardia thermophila]SHK67103.1 Right handed beta helix region [Pseudonocardia thermophila]